jgi:hypothetical protein
VELAVSAFKVPTDAPESDGTFEWDATTLMVVEADGGLGWTYAPAATGALVSDALCFAHGTPLSAHCAPNLAVHPMAASQQGCHVEWFDGALEPERGALRPDPSRPGHGMTLRRAEAERFRVSRS